MARYEHLAGYELSGCAVRRRTIIAFWGQKWNNPDPLEVRPTRAFIFYPDKSEERRWAYREPGETRGFRGCPVSVPDDRWIFVADDATVFTIGGGATGFEEAITSQPFSFFSNVKRVPPGRAVAVGPRRKVFVREGPDLWRRLDAGLFAAGEQENLDDAGFSDVDGFGETDLYACGGKSDLWHFDGKRWTRIDVPTNATLWRVCCASNGLVYVITGQREVLAGRDQNWSVIRQDLTDEVLESVVDFQGQVIISTQSGLFEVVDQTLQPASLGAVPAMRSYSFLAAGDGVLVVAGASEACGFDGTSWSVIIEPEAPPR